MDTGSCGTYKNYYLLHHADAEMYQKLIGQYLTEIPAFDLVQILSFGSVMLGDDFRSVVEMVFVH